MFRSRPRPLVGLATASAALLLASATVLAEEGFTPPVTLNTTPDDRGLHLSDLAANGDEIAVTWWEDGESWRAFVRTSDDGGASFAPRTRLNPPGLSDRSGGNFDPAIDVCGHWWWAVSQYNREPGDHILAFSLVLNARPVSGPGSQTVLLRGAGELGRWGTNGGDVACAGSRRWFAAWFQVDHEALPDSEPRVKVATRTLFPDGAPDHRYDLGRGDAGDGLALAASRSTAYVGWFRDDDFRLRRFSIGSGPGSPVTAHPTVTLFSAADGHDPVMAVHGSGVALTYSRGEDLWIRFSTDHGMTFGDEQRLIDLAPEDGTTRATSMVRVRNDVVIEANAGGDRFRLATPNSGDSVDVTPVAGGDRFAAFVELEPFIALAEAWKSGPSIRFHRAN